MSLLSAPGVFGLAAILVLLGPSARGQEEIVQLRGKGFSIFAPGRCARVVQAAFDLVLDCDFRGKNVRFYLKEGLDLPVVTSPFAPPNWRFTIQKAAAQIVKDLPDPTIIDRMKIGGSDSGSPGIDRAVLTTSGLLYKTPDDAQHNRMNLDKYILMRLQYAHNVGTAGLFAIGELDTDSAEGHPGRPYPAEAKTVLVSLGPYVERLP